MMEAAFSRASVLVSLLPMPRTSASSSTFRQPDPSVSNDANATFSASRLSSSPAGLVEGGGDGGGLASSGSPLIERASTLLTTLATAPASESPPLTGAEAAWLRRGLSARDSRLDLAAKTEAERRCLLVSATAPTLLVASVISEPHMLLPFFIFIFSCALRERSCFAARRIRLATRCFSSLRFPFSNSSTLISSRLSRLTALPTPRRKHARSKISIDHRTGTFWYEGSSKHWKERSVSVFTAIASNTSSKSSSADVGNSKTRKSVRWSHEHVNDEPSADGIVMHPVEDHEPLPASDHHLHSMAVAQPEY